MHDKEAFANFLKSNTSKTYFNINSELNIDSENFKFIGSDLDSKSIDSFLKNCMEANLSKFKIKKNEELNGKEDNKNKLISNPNILYEKINNSFEVYMGDFETIGKQFLFHNPDNKITIITNIPYGTASEMSNRIQIKALYKRFGKFLRKNMDLIDLR